MREWLDSSADRQLQDEADKKIKALQAFEQEVPAVFIVHNLLTNSVVYMSKRGLDILGVTLDQIRINNPEYHDRYFNAEDAANYVPKILGLIERNNSDDMISFFQQVRASEKEEWTWYLSSTKIFLRDKHNKPVLILTISLPIETSHHITTKVERLLQENNFLRNNHHVFASLTKREIEILKCIALGQNSAEIAQVMNISETTANTHRRNLRKKINAQSPYDITRFAQAFDLI